MASLDHQLSELREALEGVSNATKAPQMVAYMKDNFSFLGCDAASRREAARATLDASKGQPAKELLAFAYACWEQPEREFQYVGMDVLRKRAGALAPGHLADIEYLIRTKSWWDTVDSLAVWTVGPMVANHPVLSATMDAWIDDDNLWIARTAILHQLSYKERCDADRLFGYVDKRAGDTEFFIRKALGWALRQHGRTDPDGVRSFVDARSEVLSGLTKREALKHL